MSQPIPGVRGAPRVLAPPARGGERSPMARGLVLNLLASALTILTTCAFLGATVVVQDPPRLIPAAADARPVVVAFYDAINAVPRTGDPTPLDAVVAPHVVLHGALAATAAGRDGLARDLIATSAIAPGLQLVIEELAVAGDHAIVHLTPVRSTTAAFLGVPLVTPRPPGERSMRCASPGTRSSSCGATRPRCRGSSHCARPGSIPS